MAKKSFTRREFLDAAARYGVVLGGAGFALTSPGLKALLGLEPYHADEEYLQELIKRAPAARYWTSTADAGLACTSCHTSAELKGKKKRTHKPAVVKCGLCAHGCVIPDGSRGKCRTRINVRGELKSLVYGRPLSEHVDPIEKKPLYHFLPGSNAYSLATAGCPLSCRFCQNWQISQARPEDYRVPYVAPESMANRARKRMAPVVAFTYNEPTVFTEYLTDVARAARKVGIRSVLISCGFMQEAPLTEMIDVLDGIKIDLKGFSPDFYRNVSKAELAPVLRSIKQVARAGRHLEIVNLVVPTLNDSPAMLTELSKWVVGELGPDVPVHFTRFHPDYQLMNLPPTPVATLERARETALKQGMRYPFVGNVPGHPGNHTYCYKCGETVIERVGFFVRKLDLKDGKCGSCGTPIAGVWK